MLAREKMRRTDRLRSKLPQDAGGCRRTLQTRPAVPTAKSDCRGYKLFQIIKRINVNLKKILTGKQAGDIDVYTT